jgi:hypothetical protein
VRRRLGAAILAALLGCTLPDGPALAQDTDARARYDAAFAAMMADLGNPELSFQFAKAAVEAGDIRGAIAALERVLLLNPDLPNIKAELGYLYFRAGAPETAETYLAEARASGQVPPDVEARLAELEAEAQAARSRHRLDGSLFAGGRYETNASSGPGGDVRFFDPFTQGFADARTDDEEDDFSAIGSLRLTHRYDFGTQAGDDLETDLLLYGTEHADVHEEDVRLVDLTVGPNLRFGELPRTVNLRPFVDGSLLNLGGDNYRQSVGLGVDTLVPLAAGVRGSLGLRTAYEDYDNTTDRPTGSDRTGWLYEAQTGVELDLGPSTVLAAGLHGAYKDAEEGFEQYHEIGLDLGLTQYLPNPIRPQAGPASIGAGAGFAYAPYADPDPQIDPNRTREDKRLDLRLSGNLPVAAGWAVVLAFDYTNNESNYATEDFDNFGVTLGINYDFSLLPWRRAAGQGDG